METKQNLNAKKHYLHASLICGLAVLFYLYEFTVRTMPTGMTQELMRDFHITAAGLGILSSLFYYGYTVMQIPVGLLFDRFGARVLLTTAMGFCTFATVLFGMATNSFSADIAFFIIGFASSFAFIGSLVLASRWFPPKYFAMIVGLVQFLGCIGAILGVGPIVALVNKMGWRGTVFWTAFFGVIIFVLMLFFVRNQPGKDAAHKTAAAGENKVVNKNEIQRLKTVCRNPQTWWIGLYSFSSWVPIIVFAGLWGLPFLSELYQANPADAAYGITLLWLGVAIGGPIVGWWSDRIKRRCLPAALCSLIALITAVAVIYCGSLPWPAMCIFLFFFGVAASGQALSFGMVQDTHPTDVVGTAVGFNNMAVIIGGIFLQPIVGMILKYSWAGKLINDAPVYSLGNYRLALIFIPLCGLMGLYAAIFKIKETGCAPQHLVGEVNIEVKKKSNNQLDLA